MLIGPDGIVRLHHIGSGPADRPGVDVILQVIYPDLLFRPALGYFKLSLDDGGKI